MLIINYGVVVKKIIYIVVTLIIIAAIGFGVSKRIASEKSGKSDKPKHNVKEKKSLVKVTTTKAVIGDIPISVNCTGTARAIRSIEISSKVSGTVKNLKVQNGSFVKKNSNLVSIFNENIDLSYENAQLDLTKAKIEYGIEKKYSSNIDNNNSNNLDKIADINVEDLLNSSDKDLLIKHKTGLYSKLMNFKKSKIDKENCDITAPFNGYIGNLDLVEEQYINRGTHCFDLIDLSEIEVEVPVLETEIANLEIGRAAKLTFNAFPEKVFKGKVKHINPVLDKNSSTCKVVVSMENNELMIKPGMSATVSIEGTIYRDRLLVPREAIIVRDNRTLLFKVEDGLAKWVYVATGKENGEKIEILDKIKEGDEVVTSNHYTLAHNAKLKIVNN